MNAQFYHGAEVIEVSAGARPVQIPSSSVIGIIGSAGKGPVNVPTKIAGNRLEAATKFGNYQDDGFTLPTAFDGILDQIGATVVAINVCDPAVHNTAVTDEEITFDNTNKAKTNKPYVSAVSTDTTVKAVIKFRSDDTIVLPAGITSVDAVKSADGVTTYTDPTDYTVASNVITRVDGQAIAANQEVEVTYTVTLVAGTDYDLNAETGEFTRLVTGNLVAFSTIIVDYTYVDPTQVTNTDVIGGVDGTTGAYEGVQALLAAASETGSKPKILLAPGFTGSKASPELANPVVADLLTVAEKLKAVILADGPNTTDAEATAYRADWDSDRLYILDPAVKVLNPESAAVESRPYSSVMAGIIAKTDRELGFWQSPSNRVINGIIGVDRPVEFSMGDPDTRANQLNAQQITTIVREGGGFRTWGNRVASSDTAKQFLTRRRIADQIAEGILSSVLWAIDRGITKKFVEEVLKTVKAYLRQLQSIGAIAGGDAWIDTQLNTPETLSNGQLFIDYDFAPTPTAERITFRQSINNEYLTQIFSGNA